MRTSNSWLLGGGFLGLAIMIAAAAELLACLGGVSLRAQVYAGGLAGLLLGLAGLPFAAKLARIKDAGPRFWKWWVAGILSRLALLLLLAVLLGLWFRGGPAAALLSMAVVYLIGMFSEVAWLAKRIVAASGDTIPISRTAGNRVMSPESRQG